jgi:hypothetical protein
MAWFLSPSGWPTSATDGSLFAQRLTERGWARIEPAQVQPAVDAFLAGSPAPVPPNYVTVEELGTAGSPERAAAVAAVEAADPVAPVGAWDFAQAPTVGGSPIGGSTDPEVVRDTMAAALVAGANVTIIVDDVADTITVAATDTNTTDPEVVRDTIGAALVAGANVTITPDDVADTITIAASGGSGFAGYVRPEDHGAVGDGVADDTTALENAILALSTGKALYLSPGRTYTHTTVLTIATDGVGIIGAGKLLGTAELTSALKITGDKVFVSDITVETVSTQRLHPYENQRFLADGANGLVAVNVKSVKSSGTGFFLTRCDGFTLINCSAEDSWGDGFHITGGSKNGTLVMPLARRTGDDGVAVVSYEGKSDPGLCENIDIIRPVVLDQTVRGRGVTVVGGKNIRYHHIFVDRCWGPGVYFGCEPYGDNPTHGIDGAIVSGGTVRRAHFTSDIGNGAILVASSRKDQFISNSIIENLDVFDTAAERASALPYEIGAYTENGGVISNLLMRNIRATNGNATGSLLYTPLSTHDFTRHDLTRVVEPVTTLASDDFNRADATTLGTAPTGQAWTDGGTWTISANTARGSGDAWLDAGQVDMDVQATSTWDGTTGTLGVQVNVADGANRILFGIDGGTPFLRKFDAGTATTLWTGTAVTVGAGVIHRLRLRSEATQLRVYLNGALMTTYTLTGAEQTKYKGAGYTNGGLRSSGSTVGSLDDFAVSPLA